MPHSATGGSTRLGREAGGSSEGPRSPGPASGPRVGEAGPTPLSWGAGGLWAQGWSLVGWCLAPSGSRP